MGWGHDGRRRRPIAESLQRASDHGALGSDSEFEEDFGFFGSGEGGYFSGKAGFVVADR